MGAKGTKMLGWVKWGGGAIFWEKDPLGFSWIGKKGGGTGGNGSLDSVVR